MAEFYQDNNNTEFNVKKFLPIFLIVGVVLILVAFGSRMATTIESGERGVIFRKFSGGLDKENIYQPGFILIAPWNDLYVYNVKEQKIEEKMDVLDKNGLSISVDVSIRFNPMYNKIGHIHETFGVDYINQLIIPEVRSTVRKVMGRYTAEEIYSTKRKQVEGSIETETAEVLGQPSNNIQLKAMLIRSINLPQNIKNAIETKLTQEQEALAYQFKLQREKSEAERKRIAAEGESEANKIINSSLTDNLLKMRGIEATKSLVNSSNSKIIVIGGGKDGLPLILNGQ